MCYNVYRVCINSSGKGWKDEISSDGEVSDGDVFRVRYSIDGDECVLTVNGKKAVQERRGGQCVKISFEEGKNTECQIGNGGLSGSYSVFTRKMQFFRGKGGYRLSLEYFNGSDKELIKLTFTAVKKGNGYEN